MTEKRFWFVIDKGKLDYVQDNVSKEKITVSELEDLLNEQQATINELQDTVYDELDKALKVLEEIYEDYPKDNVHHLHSRLKGLLEEFR